MAPEVLAGKNHNHSVDYFAVGVIGYELMMGKRPYRGKNRKEIKQQIINKQIFINENEIPFNWSFDSADFINKLLIRKDVNRLGYYNEKEIFNHEWVKNVNWNIYNNKNILAPYIPDNFRENIDKKYCEGIELEGEKTKERYDNYRNNIKYNNLFENFTFYNISMFDNYDKFNMNNIYNLCKNKSTQIKIKNIKKTRSNNNILDNSKCKISHNKNHSEIKNIKLNINNIKLIPKIQNNNNNINIKLTLKKANSLNNQHNYNKSFDLKLKDYNKQHHNNNNNNNKINIKDYNSEKKINSKYHSHSYSNIPKNSSIKLLNFNNTINSNIHLINNNNQKSTKNNTKIKLLQNNNNNKYINKIPIPHSNTKIKNNQKIKIIKKIEKFILIDKSPTIKKINYKNNRPPSSQRTSIKKINLYFDKFNDQKISFNNTNNFTTNNNSNQITDKNIYLNNEKTEIKNIKSERNFSNNYLINYLSNKNEEKIKNSPKVYLNCSNNKKNKNYIKFNKLNSFDKLNIKTYNSNEYSTASSSNKKK